MKELAAEQLCAFTGPQLHVYCIRLLQDKLKRDPTGQETMDLFLELVQKIETAASPVLKKMKELDSQNKELRSLLIEFLVRHDAQPPDDREIVDEIIDRTRVVLK